MAETVTWIRAIPTLPGRPTFVKTPPAGGSTTSRMLALLTVTGLIALAGGALRIACIGRSCEQPESAAGQVPFCGLPAEVREQVGNGFREGRSPNVLGVTRKGIVSGGSAFKSGMLQPRWPSVAENDDRVPLVFAGTGIDTGTTEPASATLDQVAPTIAEIIGLRRPHPEVRSGAAIDAVASGDLPRLVVVVVEKGVGSELIDNVPSNLSAIRESGQTFVAPFARPGSAPTDPAAVLTTIGTGGIPKQHGITGTLLRNDTGELVQAWGKRAPISVIATLADDLDEFNRQIPLIGVVGNSESDRGLIGGNWYIQNDEDDVAIVEGASPRKIEQRARELLATGYGNDNVTDLLAVALEGSVDEMDAALGEIYAAARESSGDSVAIVVTATGSASGAATLSADDVRDQVNETLGAEVVEATTPGGIFVDQDVLASADITEDEVLNALSDMKDPDGTRVFEDVFTAIAVTFERYC